MNEWHVRLGNWLCLWARTKELERAAFLGLAYGWETNSKSLGCGDGVMEMMCMINGLLGGDLNGRLG